MGLPLYAGVFDVPTMAPHNTHLTPEKTLAQRETRMDYAAMYRRSIADRDAFWQEQASRIEWHRPFKQVCDFSPPTHGALVRRRPNQSVP